MAGNKPVHRISAGRGVVASIWENEGKSGPFFSVTVDRAYKDGDETKSSFRFTRDDLLAASKALDLAHTWILARESTNGLTWVEHKRIDGDEHRFARRDV